MAQTGNPTTLAALNAEIISQLPTAGSPPISANTLRQVLLDLASTLEGGPTFDPSNPPSTAVVKGNRALIADYTFGTTASPLLAGAQPITTLAQLNQQFWTTMNFASQPMSGASGAGSIMSTRFCNESPWHNFSGTSTMTVESTDLLIQGQLNAAVTTDASLTKLQQTSTTTVNITGTGSFTFTIPTGLDWIANDAIQVDSLSKVAQGEGTITSYNSGTGAVVVNLTNVEQTGSASDWVLTRWPIKTGMIRSKTPYLYGFFEMYAQLPSGNGNCTQFWLYVDNQSLAGGTIVGSSPNEIDILEQLINAPKGIDGTWSWSNWHVNGVVGTPVALYYDARTGSQLNGGSFSFGNLLFSHPSFDITSGFHKFQCLWVPGYVAFYVDDIPTFVGSMPWKQANGNNSGFADIIANYSIGVSGNNFAGLPQHVAAFPGNWKIQYIRVWQSASETAAGAAITAQSLLNQLLGGPGLISAWVATRSTLATGAASDPSGGTNAALLTEDATASNNHYIEQDITGLSGSATYTFSAKIKVGGTGTRNIALSYSDFGFINTVFAVFNPSTGALVGSALTTGAAVVSATNASNLGSGWFQVWVTSNLNLAGSGIFRLIVYMVSGSSGTYTGDGASNVLLFDPHMLLGTSP